MYGTTTLRCDKYYHLACSVYLKQFQLAYASSSSAFDLECTSNIIMVSILSFVNYNSCEVSFHHFPFSCCYILLCMYESMLVVSETINILSKLLLNVLSSVLPWQHNSAYVWYDGVA